jgi:hypothetical protein
MSFAPLEGKVVVDVTASLAGPYCTQLLGALGADVIKVEPPGGDHARAWGPPFVGGDGALWFAANAGKRSVVVDRERILELVDGADVFVQSLRPGLAERHGIDAASLRAQALARARLDRRVCRPSGVRPARASGDRDHELGPGLSVLPPVRIDGERMRYPWAPAPLGGQLPAR